MFSLLTSLVFASENPDFNKGVERMTNKDYSATIVSFEACIDIPENLSCHWEIGWAHWMLSDWNAVVKHWSIVEEQDPTWPKLSGYLTQAKDNLNLQNYGTKSKQCSQYVCQCSSKWCYITDTFSRRYDDWYQFSKYGYLPANNGATLLPKYQVNFKMQTSLLVI